MSPASHAATAPRQGVILLVVVSLLTLFAVVGLSFVLYAESAAKASQLHRQAENLERADVEPEQLLKFFLGQFLYGTEDVFSALRGHSLADNMYGFNRQGHNVIPYSGMGRFRHTYPATAPEVLRGHDNFDLVNYTAFGRLDPTSCIRDPERFGLRGTPEHDRFINGSVSYTYPDANNLFLGAVNGDGRVLARSFYRAYTSGDPNDPMSRVGFGPLGDRSNPHWTDAIGKYLTLRPRPADHSPAFPYPEDEGGDVKNLNNAQGGNDSIWIDLGFPVQVTPDGRKFKPLFAAFIEDLDNRVNVNVHGNIRGVVGGNAWWNGRAGGNQAWGPWEINLERVIRQNNEARNLFIGASVNGQHVIPGRYDLGNRANYTGYWGRDDHRAGVTRLPFGPFYSRTNSDGNSPSNDRDAMRLPGRAGWNGHHSFPAYNSNYANADFGSEARNNPVLFNFLDPSYTAYYTGGTIPKKDRVFAHSNLEALLRFGDTGSPALTSELFKLCPNSFNNAKTRRLVSTIGFDVDRPGIVPSEYTPGGPAAGPVPYQFNQGLGYAVSPALPRPEVSQPPPPHSEFGPDWHALSAALGRINLNRKLPDYPRPDGDDPDQNGTRRIAPNNLAQYQRARTARQEFAEEIYRCLIAVTGAYNPDWLVPGEFEREPTPGEIDALRWLAQLAVNIVDFIDRDDYMTPFHWGNVGSVLFRQYLQTWFQTLYPGRPEKTWVFGTELPRLVLNEVYAEQDASSQIRFWVELHNPLRVHGRDDPEGARWYLTEKGCARLQVSATGVPNPPGSPYGAYQLVVAELSQNELAQPHNVLGDVTDGRKKIIVSNFTSNLQHSLSARERQLVRPTRQLNNGNPRDGGNADNDGFFVIGPSEDVPGIPANTRLATLRIPTPPDPASRNRMFYQGPPDAPPRHTILLRRLACPHIPEQPDPTVAHYNPYITVDYLGSIPTNAVTTPAGNRRSFERQQPYGAQRAVEGNNRQRFFRVSKSRTDGRFVWLTFHDRPLINPMELLDVPGYRPCDLTQKFATPAGVTLGHRAPWFDARTRIYRFLEFLEGGELLQGVTTNGRSIGKINLNTIWDIETFQALINRNPVNKFSDADVTNAYNRMVRQRTVSPQGTPGPKDQPFLGFATPHTPTQDGLEATFLRLDPAGPAGKRLFETDTGGAPDNHPYYRFELLRKIMSNATARSNVFAVHLTIGFFEVLNDSNRDRPPVLGAEVGKAENRHIRHRLFALVDRTNLTVSPGELYAANPPNYPLRPGPRPFFMNTDSYVVPNGANPVRVNLPRVPSADSPNRYEDHVYVFNADDSLVFDTGPHQEIITVRETDPINHRITAPFNREHNRGVPISNVLFPRNVAVLPPPGLTILGHPGPQLRFDPHDPRYSGVVRYMSVIVK